MVAIKEDLWRRTCALPEPELCHLFTDGSCHGGRHRLYQLAAWAVVSATSDSCIASGALGGLGQDIDRAELRATIAAVQYAVDIQRDTVVWTDSTFAAEGLVRLLRDGDDLPDGHCAEDWIELQGLLCQCDVQIWVHHVPGHAHWVNQDADVDNWAARWNDRADREANMAMKMHGGELLRLHQQLWEHHEGELSDVCALQALHLDIIEKPQQIQQDDGHLDTGGDEGQYDLRVERGCPASHSPLIGLPNLDDARWETILGSFGQSFVVNFVQVIKSWEDEDSAVICKLSFLEIAVFLATEGKRWIPMPHLTQPGCWQDRDTLNFNEPNLGALVRLAKAFLQMIDRRFSLEISWCKGINLNFLGVCTPLDGLTLAIPVGVADRSMDHLKCFTRRRPIRKANDLARPFRA